MRRKPSRFVHRRYLAWLLLPALLVTATFSANYLFLKQAGEYLSASEIVDRQLARGGLYSSGIGDMTYRYKLELFHRVRPRVAVLGSSRAMQFHGRPFTRSFVNLGGAVNSIGEARILARQMLARHKPDLVILAIDYWWFNDAVEEPAEYPSHALVRRDFRLAHLYKPFLWLADGKVGPGTYFRVLAGDARNIGTQAVVWDEGYDRYGGAHFSRRIDGSRPHNHRRMAVALGWVRDGVKGMTASAGISQARLVAFGELLDDFDEAGVAVVTVLPPMAAAVLKAMATKGGFGYIASLRRRLPALARWHLDAHDPRTLGSDDCEFLDGSHGGEVVYLRILEALAALPASPVAGVVDRAAIHRDIQVNAGHATAWRQGEPSPGEVDFLDIGCAKPRDRIGGKG